MNSTDLHPLAYFEYIIDSKNILDEIQNEFLYSDCVSFDIRNSKEIQYVVQNDFGEFTEKSILTKDLLFQKLYRESQKAKNNLYSYCLDSTKSTIENYLRIQINTLQALINKNPNLINDHLYLMLPLRDILNYINDILLLPEMERFLLDETYISPIEIDGAKQNPFDSTLRSDIEKIHLIFEYMKGNNEQKEKILSDEDFDLLIKYTTELIEQEKVPIVDKQLKPKISNELIRFTYWFLHKELYTSRPVRSYFYTFIKTVFSNFEKTEISSIKSVFGTKKRIPNYSFLPEFILESLK